MAILLNFQQKNIESFGEPPFMPRPHKTSINLMKYQIALSLLLCFSLAPPFKPDTQPEILCTPAVASSHSQADMLFDQANSADLDENYKSSAEKYDKLFRMLRKTDPSNPLMLRALARLGRAYLLQNEFDKAEPMCTTFMHEERKNLERSPEVLIDLDDMSDAYLIMAKTPHYRYESLKRCIALRKLVNPNHPRLPSAYRELAEYCLSCNNPSEAAVDIKQAIAIEQKNPPSKQMPMIRDENFLASLYMVKGDNDKAIATANDCITHLKKLGGEKILETQLHVTIGRVYSQRKQFDLADQEFKLAATCLKECKSDNKKAKDILHQYVRENEALRAKARHRH